MAAGLAQATETDVGLQIGWPMVLAVVAGCAVLALLATVIVTGRMLRVRPGS